MINQEKTKIKLQVIDGRKSAPSNIEKWREAFNTTDPDAFDVWELEEAREGLLSTKSEPMKRWDYKYKLVIKKLFKRLQYGENDKRVYFDLLQQSFRTIVNNDNTEELEKLHVAMIEALFEWEIKYTLDSSHYKKDDEYGLQWRNAIDRISFLVLKECKKYSSPLFPSVSPKNR